jgi:hypothetical protein
MYLTGINTNFSLTILSNKQIIIRLLFRDFYTLKQKVIIRYCEDIGGKCEHVSGSIVQI